MAENENIDNTEELVDETAETPEKKSNSKSFTQKELDTVVQNRLKSEQKKFTGMKTEWESRETELNTQIAKYEEILQKHVDSLSKDLPESTKKLLSKLSVLEQMDWLAENANPQTNVVKKTIPVTPKSDNSKEDTKSSKPINRFKI